MGFGGEWYRLVPLFFALCGKTSLPRYHSLENKSVKLRGPGQSPGGHCLLFGLRIRAKPPETISFCFSILFKCFKSLRVHFFAPRTTSPLTIPPNSVIRMIFMSSPKDQFSMYQMSCSMRLGMLVSPR